MNMKKILVVILALCPFFLCVLGNPVRAEGILPDPKDRMVFSFEDGKTSVLAQMNLDYEPYNIGQSPVEAALENTDTGKGFLVRVSGVSNAACQHFSAPASGLFAQAGSYKYCRVWVSNQGESALSIGLQITAAGKTASLNAGKASVTRCDGEKAALETADSAGSGQDHVRLPAGFAGWVAFPLTEAPTGLWGAAVPSISEFPMATKIELDVRVEAVAAADFYVLDDICLTDSASGVSRKFENNTESKLEEKMVKLAQELKSTMNAFNAAAPKVTYMPAYNPAGVTNNIQALTYEGAGIGGKKTKVFAYIGYPKAMKQGEKLPAVVLVHGGGGWAFPNWVDYWNSRGYIAIAMDHDGQFPDKEGKFSYGLKADFAESGFVNAPPCDNYNTTTLALEKQWMYHAVAQTILAKNILKADKNVDAAKIGITGISWGSMITSNAIGFTDFAFAAPQYISGYISSSVGGIVTDWFNQNSGCKYLWKSEDRYANVNFPVLFVSWTQDIQPVDCVSLSYLNIGGAALTVLT